ncbi:hypothetical protein FOMPIDRAFT_1021302 [Fomitopsis schrenkii]|uniref:DUF6533 domain-containing protein n=1 Tax=Fomitopsis schrenkii TaxID=2126942 RepID=S8G5H6_FOMSC|nr:hypothetical protein FOMPIDRAFT_1021302 [Fomitopsis schrenkii]
MLVTETINGMSVLDYVANYISSNHCVTVATVLITYDYLITFDDEVAHLWSISRRKVPSSLLFAGSRASLLVLALAYIGCCVQAAYRSVGSCTAISVATAFIEAFVFLIIASVSALRVRAVSQGKWGLAFLAFALASLPAAMNIFIALRTTYSIIQFGSFAICVGVCNGTIDRIHEIVEIVIRTASIASDVVVVSATWYYCYDPELLRLSIISRILKDGSIYFVAILTLNIVNLFVWFYAHWTSINMIVLPVSAILVSRSLINLRQTYHVTMQEENSRQLSRSSAGLSTSYEPTLVCADDDTLHSAYFEKSYDGKVA